MSSEKWLFFGKHGVTRSPRSRSHSRPPLGLPCMLPSSPSPCLPVGPVVSTLCSDSRDKHCSRCANDPVPLTELLAQLPWHAESQVVMIMLFIVLFQERGLQPVSVKPQTRCEAHARSSCDHRPGSECFAATASLREMTATPWASECRSLFSAQLFSDFSRSRLMLLLLLPSLLRFCIVCIICSRTAGGSRQE